MNNVDVRYILANNLRTYRIAAGLTAKEVGDAIGKSDKTVSGWEHERGQPDADMLFALCNLYQIKDISVFFPDSVSSEPAPRLSPAESELLSLYRSLNADGQSLVIMTARTCAGNPAMQKDATGASAM